MIKPLIFLGAGGHAKVLFDLVTLLRFEVVGICDPNFDAEKMEFWRDIQILNESEVLQSTSSRSVDFVNAVGQIGLSTNRANLYRRFKDAGYTFPTLIHPYASVSPFARLSEGVQIMAGAVVQADCVIGENTVINTRVSVDHDCAIGRNVHIAPGVIVSGSAEIGDDSFLGAGSVVIQNIKIGSSCVVGSGAVVIRDFLGPGKLLGVPAKLSEKKCEI